MKSSASNTVPATGDAADTLLYSVENVIAQMASAPETFGFFTVRFYSDGTRPSRERTDRIDTYYYFPSGGTLRDLRMNIIVYEPKLDAYSSASRIGGAGDL
jgi:hypothetical protein